jgi:hypothetical protein
MLMLRKLSRVLLCIAAIMSVHDEHAHAYVHHMVHTWRESLLSQPAAASTYLGRGVCILLRRVCGAFYAAGIQHPWWRPPSFAVGLVGRWWKLCVFTGVCLA